MSTCRTDLDKPNEKQIERLKSIISKLPTDEALNYDADALKALADPTRMKIIYLLKFGELCACEIIAALDKPQPTVSHHLNILKKAGFLNGRKQGVWIHYSLSDPKITDNLSKILKKD